MNENGVRQFGQKPSVRPGLSSRPRPTGLPQFEQNRFDSGSSATAMTAFSGSVGGSVGTVVSPAPRRGPRRRVDVVPKRRVAFDPVAAVRAEPSAAVASRDDDVRPVRVEPACAKSASGPAPVCGPAEKPVPSFADGDAAAAVPVPDAAGRGVGDAGEPQTLQ